MFEYKNSFHNTAVMSKKSPEELEEIRIKLATGKASDSEKAFARKMRKELCGVAGCKCSDEFGIRK